MQLDDLNIPTYIQALRKRNAPLAKDLLKYVDICSLCLVKQQKLLVFCYSNVIICGEKGLFSIIHINDEYDYIPLRVVSC